MLGKIQSNISKVRNKSRRDACDTYRRRPACPDESGQLNSDREHFTIREETHGASQMNGSIGIFLAMP